MNDMDSLYRHLYEQARHELVVERWVWRIFTALLIVALIVFGGVIK